MRLVFRSCEETSGCGDINHCPNQFCNASKRQDSSVGFTSTTPNYNEYYLGAQGSSCTEACEAKGLYCDASTDLGDEDQGAKMMNHLGVADCLKNATAGGKPQGLTWWAPDQPSYVSGASHAGRAEENYRQCVGWVGYPRESKCGASYATVQRVCHCVNVAPPEPPSPSPIPSGAAEYSTLVWTYEWPREEALSSADAAAPALRVLQVLAGQALLSQDEEDSATDLLLADDPGALRLLGAFPSDLEADTAERVARQLRRHLTKSSYV